MTEYMELVSLLTHIKKDMTELKDNINKLRDTQIELKGNINELRDTQIELKGNINELRDTQIELKGNINELRDTQLRMDDIVNQNVSNFEKAGATFELVVRSELRTSRGIDYCRPFTVKELHGLGRLSLPKNIHVSSKGLKTVDEWKNTSILVSRVERLLQQSSEGLNNLKQWHTTMSGKVHELLDARKDRGLSDEEKFLT